MSKQAADKFGSVKVFDLKVPGSDDRIEVWQTQDGYFMTVSAKDPVGDAECTVAFDMDVAHNLSLVLGRDTRLLTSDGRVDLDALKETAVPSGVIADCEKGALRSAKADLKVQKDMPQQVEWRSK